MAVVALVAVVAIVAPSLVTAPALVAAPATCSDGAACRSSVALLASGLCDLLSNVLILGNVLGLWVRHGGGDVPRHLSGAGLHLRLLLLLGVRLLLGNVAVAVGRDDYRLRDASSGHAGELVGNPGVNGHMSRLGDMDGVL